MKKLIISLTVLMIICAGSTAFAADETKATIGLKVWFNSWEETSEFEGTSETTDFGSAVMVGPSVNIQFPSNWFIGGSYLVTTQDYEAKDFVFVGDKLTTSRQDLDLMAGYMFNPQFGLFFGYKSITADAKYTLEPYFSNEALGTWDLKGPGIGILGNIPLGETTALYGSLSIMSIEATFTLPDGTSSSTDLVGASAEIGVAFGLTQSLSANIGVKAQSFTGEDAGVTTTDTFSGLTLGLNYTF